jgi:hypothetical protein
MSRADIIAALRERASDIRNFGATSLYLFGSTARNEATEGSDVDLFIDYDPERFSFVGSFSCANGCRIFSVVPPTSPHGMASIRFCGRKSRLRRSRCCSGSALAIHSEAGS